MRHKNLLSILLFIAVCRLHAQHQLTIQIQNIETPKGTLFLGLFDSPRDYDNNQSKTGFFTQTIVNGATASITYQDLPVGLYAIKAYHDVNNNKMLDKNFIGLPREQYGFSNNVMGAFGPPSFEQSQFEITEDTTQVLILR